MPKIVDHDLQREAFAKAAMRLIGRAGLEGVTMRAVAAHPKLKWRFGVDARGNEVAANIRDNPHLAIIAQTNWGKSVLSASLIENLRPFGSWWLFDGKGADHPAQLAQQPGIAWISKTAPEHVVGMKWLWDEMNERYLEADQRKAQGKGGAAFDFPPIFVLIDETPSLRGGIETHDKNGIETFDYWVQDLLQKGRQARIHLIIISQSLYVDSVPSTWQMNLGRIIFLGPVSGRSLASDAVPESIRSVISEMTARIPESAKGRGVYTDKSGGVIRPIQIQTYYDWAPGTTSIEMAPTPEVREAWLAQQAALADRPRLFDRVGIEVSDPDWRKLTVEELAELPTVIVADEHGAIEGMEGYDPLSEAFYGRVRITANRNRARGRGSGVTAPPPPSGQDQDHSRGGTAEAEVSVKTNGHKKSNDDTLLRLLAEAARREQVAEPVEPEPTAKPKRGGGEF